VEKCFSADWKSLYTKNQNCIFENYDFLVDFLGRVQLFHDKIEATLSQPAQWSIALSGLQRLRSAI